MSILGLALALSCYFPVFASDTSSTGMSIVNIDGQTHQHAVTFINSSGNAVETVNLSLAPNTQRAFILREAFANPLPQAGWIRMESEASRCSAFLTVDNGRSLEAAEAASATSEVLVIPHVEVNTGFVELGHTDTTILIANPSESAAVVTVELFDLQGNLQASQSRTLPRDGSSEFLLSETFQNALPSNGLGGRRFEGYVRVSSSRRVVAWQRVETPLARSILLAQPPLDRGPVAYFAHFAFSGQYESVLNIINPGDAAVDLELSALANNGATLGDTVRLTLAPGEARRASVAELFRIPVIAIYPPPLITGHIRVRRTDGGAISVAGNLLLAGIDQGRRSLMLEPITGSPSTQWVLPFALADARYYTGYVVINPESLLTVQTDVRVQFWNSDGVLIEESSLQFSPGTRSVDLLKAGGQVGYLRFISNFPIYIFGTIGTMDREALESVPAIP